MNKKKLIQQMLGSVLATGITLLSVSSALAAETYGLFILDSVRTILKSEHGLRIGVEVNDFSSISMRDNINQLRFC